MKYEGKAHMSGLHRDINVPRNFPQSGRVQKPRERTGGRAGPGAERSPCYRDQSGPASRTMLHQPKGLRKTMRLWSV